MRRPKQRLGDDDAVAVERHTGAAVELIAQFKSLAHAPTEGIIIRPGQDSIERQALRRWARHRGMISRASDPNCRNRRASLSGFTWPRTARGSSAVSGSDTKRDQRTPPTVEHGLRFRPRHRLNSQPSADAIETLRDAGSPAPDFAGSRAHENACGNDALPVQHCRRLPADTAPARALGSGEAIARLAWP